eukprot:CCRYP_001994-RB/>CCRYP_001994-RB protein AED:0.45 eAED:1.00 QI:0/0/0/1/0/0/2/0/109
MIIQLFVRINISTDGIKQYQVVEALGHFRIEIGCKNTCCCIHCLRRPLVRTGQVEDFFPVVDHIGHGLLLFNLRHDDIGQSFPLGFFISHVTTSLATHHAGKQRFLLSS